MYCALLRSQLRSGDMTQIAATRASDREQPSLLLFYEIIGQFDSPGLHGQNPLFWACALPIGPREIDNSPSR